MALSLKKEILLEALQKAYPVIPLKSSLQILSNFRIRFDESKLEISATDLDQSVRVFVQAEGTEKFDITVNAKKIFEIVRELPEGTVSLTVSENVLIIQSEKNFNCRIAGADATDFPGIPEIVSSVEFSMQTSMVRNLFSKSGFAVSKDESRACLAGVLWELAPERTGMVATDGHRLGSSFIKHQSDLQEPIRMIVSPRTLGHLVRIMDAKGEERLSVRVNEKYCSFSSATFTLYSKLVEGPYPDYSKVIPQNNSKEAVVNRSALLSAVKRVSVLSNQKTHMVKFSFAADSLAVTVVNKEIGGEAKETMEIGYKGDAHSIGFNGQYFNEILDIIKTPRIRIKMNTQISACLLLPEYEKETEAESDDLFLIMPLRIMEG